MNDIGELISQNIDSLKLSGIVASEYGGSGSSRDICKDGIVAPTNGAHYEAANDTLYGLDSLTTSHYDSHVQKVTAPKRMMDDLASRFPGFAAKLQKTIHQVHKYAQRPDEMARDDCAATHEPHYKHAAGGYQ